MFVAISNELNDISKYIQCKSTLIQIAYITVYYEIPLIQSLITIRKDKNYRYFYKSKISSHNDILVFSCLTL